MTAVPTEVKKAHEALLSAFEEFKKTNDERFAALAKGEAVSHLDEKLAKMTVDLDNAEKAKSSWQKAQEAKFAEIERKLEARENRARLGVGGAGDGDDEESSIPMERKRDLPGERKAFWKFVRKGLGQLGDDEKKVLVERKSITEQKVMTIGDATTGGFLAPPQYASSIIKAAVLYTPARDYVTVQRIGTGEYLQPKRTQTAAASRAGEIGTKAETQNPNYGVLRIPAPEMFAKAIISQQNLEDSAFDLEQVLRDEFAEQFGVKEGAEFVSGTGVNQLLGITDPGASGVQGVGLSTTGTGTATIAGASGVQGDPLVNLCHALKTPYAVNGRWALNRKSLGKVRLLKDTQGRYLWDPGIGLAANMPPTILGYPYFEAPDMPDEASNALPVAFGDFKRGYMIVERVDIMIIRDNLTLADNGQVKFIARRRVGGQVVLPEAIQLLKCA